VEDARSEADNVEDEDDGTEQPPEGRHEPCGERLKINWFYIIFILPCASWNQTHSW